MFKLALTAGHYLGTPGKRCMKALDPNETREWWLNDRVADRIQFLLSEYEGIEILRTDDTTGQAAENLTARTNAANNFKADFYLSVHHNAGIGGGTGGGIETYIYNGGVSQATKDWQNDLYNELIKLTGLKGNRSDGTRSANFHEVRETSMPAVLLELGFMDSKTDVPIILTQDFAYKCAQACCNVIVRRAGLKKKTTTTTTVGSTYKLVTEVNRYASAADAQAKTNSKGKYAAGTYYIFKKYPNGLNGMYNISTDKTGASAGSWINPSENKIKEVKEEVQKLYRVRLSKDDAKSQKGAFSDLQNAEDCCQSAGEGYHVFDWNWKIVYSYKAPVTPTPVAPKEETKQETTTTVTVTAVYNLDYPIKTKIIDKTIKRTDNDCTKAIKLICLNNLYFDIEIAKAFFKLAPKYGIDPMMAIAQSILETGWFKYEGSAVKSEQHNYCGLGVTSNGVEGGKFNTIEDGVTAQLQHLFAYGCKDALPTGEKVLDPRFSLVTRGIATYWQQLAGRWACPGYDKNIYKTPEEAMKAENTYGQKILNLFKQIEKVAITDEDVKKYFGKEEPKVEEPKVDPIEPKVEPEDDELPEINKNWLTKLIKMIIEILFDLFRSKED